MAKRKKRATIRKTRPTKVKMAKESAKRAAARKSRRTFKKVAAKTSRKRPSTRKRVSPSRKRAVPVVEGEIIDVIDKPMPGVVHVTEIEEARVMVPSYAPKERFYSSESNGQVTVREGSDKRSLNGRSDLHDHSAMFEWGRDSAGATQLSLALLADALGSDARAQSLHQTFKDRVVVDLPARWTITRSRILAHAKMLERK